MLMVSWIDFVLITVLLLRLLGGQNHSTADRSERYMTWMTNYTQQNLFKLQMCTIDSETNMLTCNNFIWSHPESGHCTSECEHSRSGESCKLDQQFYQDWIDHPKCNCSSESTTSETTSSATFTATMTSAATPVTHCNKKCPCQPSKSGQILKIFVAILAVLLVLVISGWVWTCWKLKKQIKSSQTNNILMSALQSTSKPNSEMKITGENALYSGGHAQTEYHKLDRGNERSKVKTSAFWCQQKGGTENYSVLTYDW